MTDRELMQMALEVLECDETYIKCAGGSGKRQSQAAAALRERLYGKWEPQIEQLYTPKGDLISISIKRTADGPREQIHPKREWIGLTEDEYKTIRYGSDEDGNPYVDHELFDEGEYGFEINIYVDRFASAIEAKLKEKNT